jgi:SEC-C motif-containing protein
MESTFEKIPRVRDQSLCPCKSRLPYGECCGPYHRGKVPQTAEQLMRSRYSAYFFRLIDYLVDTTHPDKKTPQLRQEIQATADQAMWRFLTILGTSKGQSEDKTGKVEFLAEYYFQDVLHEHHERSRFRRYKGAWKYVDDKG